MVKIVDLTEQAKKEIERGKLEEKLAYECFKGKTVKLFHGTMLDISNDSGTLASKITQIRCLACGAKHPVSKI